MFEVHHHEGLAAMHFAARNKKVSNAIDKALAAGVDWGAIIAAIMSQLPNVLSGNWAAVVAAILALIVNKP